MREFLIVAAVLAAFLVMPGEANARQRARRARAGKPAPVQKNAAPRQKREPVQKSARCGRRGARLLAGARRCG